MRPPRTRKVRLKIVCDAILPASHLIASDESERTRIVGKIARSFGNLTNPIIVVLVITGLYNATWYLP